MKNNISRMPSVTIAVLMLFSVAWTTGCTDKEQKQDIETSALATKAKANLDTEVKTVVDQNGRLVKLPREINRVVMVPLPLPSLYYVITGSCEKIVGINPGTKSKVKPSMLGVLAPELMNTASNFVKGKDINIEELLKLKPDIVFFWGLYPNQVQQFEAVDIPAVGVYTVKGGDALETLRLWMKLLGKIFNEEVRASEMIAHNEKTMEIIDSRIREIPQEKKPRALILFRHSRRQIGIPGRDNYGQFWLKSTGAIDVAESISGMTDVNMEQIYKWNPDIIYISNFSKTLPEDLLNNRVKGQDWSRVKAIKEGRVYKIPLGIYRWFPPSADAPLMLKWMAQIHHPDLFNDYSIKEEIKHHSLRFYNYVLSDEQVENILHPLREPVQRTTK